MMMRTPAISERGAMVDASSEKLGMDRGDVRVMDEEDDRFIMERNLVRWGVEDYMMEIEDLYSSRWEGDHVGGWF